MLYKIFLEHPRDTDYPETYFHHFKRAFFGSCLLIWACFFGIIHAFIPALFPFYTANKIIDAFYMLMRSGRHFDHIQEWETTRATQEDWVKHGLKADKKYGIEKENKNENG